MRRGVGAPCVPGAARRVWRAASHKLLLMGARLCRLWPWAARFQVNELQQKMSRFHGLTASNPERKTLAQNVTTGCEQVGAMVSTYTGNLDARGSRGGLGWAGLMVGRPAAAPRWLGGADGRGGGARLFDDALQRGSFC